MSDFAVVTVGDSILDTFLSLSKPSSFARFQKQTEELCIRSGAKVLIDDANFCLGGNASNVAVGLSRLGHKVALIAEFGDDEFSEKLRNGLKKENVYLEYALETKNTPSTFSVILNILGDRTAFIRHVKRSHKFSFEKVSTKWLYLTSLGQEWEEVYKKVVDYKTRSASSGQEIKLAFNPGSAQILAGPESFKDVLAVTDILFVNRDEAEIILHGKLVPEKQEEKEEDLLFRIQRMGPKMIVMTDGENGSYVMDEKAELFYEKSAKCNVVEKTGAGDGYGTGFLGAILHGKSIEEAMRWGALNAASVIEHVGSEDGLLTKKDMEDKEGKSAMKIAQVSEQGVSI